MLLLFVFVQFYELFYQEAIVGACWGQFHLNITTPHVNVKPGKGFVWLQSIALIGVLSQDPARSEDLGACPADFPARADTRPLVVVVGEGLSPSFPFPPPLVDHDGESATFAAVSAEWSPDEDGLLLGSGGHGRRVRRAADSPWWVLKETLAGREDYPHEILRLDLETD